MYTYFIEIKLEIPCMCLLIVDWLKVLNNKKSRFERSFRPREIWTQIENNYSWKTFGNGVGNHRRVTFSSDMLLLQSGVADWNGEIL